MGYWKSKVLPKIKKVFEVNGAKKAAVAEALKSFEESKEEISKEFEEKKDELKPKVLEIYEASSDGTKSVVKTRTEAGLKKNSAGVKKLLEELAKIDFPGSKAASEASAKVGTSAISSSIFFLFEKVATFIPEEEAAPAVEATAREVEVTAEEPVAAAAEEVVAEKTEEVVEEKKAEDKKEEEASAPVVTAAAEPAAAPEPTAAAVVAVVVEEVKAEVLTPAEPVTAPAPAVEEKKEEEKKEAAAEAPKP